MGHLSANSGTKGSSWLFISGGALLAAFVLASVLLSPRWRRGAEKGADFTLSESPPRGSRGGAGLDARSDATGEPAASRPGQVPAVEPVVPARLREALQPLDAHSPDAYQPAAALARLRTLLANAWTAPALMDPAASREVQALEEALVRAGPAAVPALMEALDRKDAPAPHRVRFLQLLGRISDPRASAAVERHAGRGGEEVLRAAAIGALGDRRDAAAVEALEAIVLHETDFGGRHLAVASLGRTGHPRVPGILADRLRSDADRSVRSLAAQALGGCVGDPSVREALRSAARSDPFPPVRANAVVALARSGEPDLDAFLQDIETGDADPAVRLAARSCRNRPSR